VNGSLALIDPENPLVKPEIFSDRTMLPLRFVGENLGAEVQWHKADRSITIARQANKEKPALEEKEEEKKLTSEELVEQFEKHDASVERTDTRVVEFEKVKGLKFGEHSFEDLAKIMIGETAQIEKFQSEDVLGCSASAINQGAEVLILKFPDVLSAGEYMILLQSELKKAGYTLIERLDYSEVALHFCNPDNSHIYLDSAEKGNFLITLLKVFDEWGRIFHDPVLATAILDRFVHHCHFDVIKGEIYRMKQREKHLNVDLH